ncbi:hypothetical protein MGYG_08426 [Nannizzia gypsea CBS 118893]|uniref:Altered inheritance of mitochondria protein 9, mitochondrial n=1 Tax=Arthroderma gypseum (strain ATCC MYA-4604 / CBS 118893) TaxID=535722 RepID=E4V5N9_ARTGP|nr:hypothetical protein MGYG_08426 [Nannizzia gypsea CBS 118893]EFR05414.1 hypothetical protein MGYG_08426 [Nannizzia gypsea CBS 118893]
MGGNLSSPISGAHCRNSSRPFSGGPGGRIHPVPSQDPCAYTAGRFLLQDELQRNARHVQFNFTKLCEVAISVSEGACRVISYEKKEGGYNRVFILSLDNGKRIVARIPTRVAGAPRLTTNSEVATIAYLQSKTSLPLPKVLAWCDDPSNPVGAEYIIQAHVDGILLHEQWPHMDALQHMRCTKHLSQMTPEMTKLNFPAYGNIYFSDAPIEAGLKVPLQDDGRFCIGPYCSPLFWHSGSGEPELYGEPSENRGPWKTLDDYVSGLIDTALSRIPKEQDNSLPYRGSTEEHVRLVKVCQEIMHKLVQSPYIQQAGMPALIHADYNKRNIFVSSEDPTAITGIIDWQLTCVEPAFIYAHMTPDFAAFPEIDPSEDGSEPKSKEEEKLLKDLSICSQTFDVIMTHKNPKIKPGRLLDSTFFRLFHYCFTTWRDGIPAIRQELIDLSSLWHKPELNLPAPYPYVPSEQELAGHKKQYDDFEAREKLKAWLRISLQTTSDGWIPNELWKDAKEANRMAYEQWMETAREAEARGDDDMTVEKAEKLWPFDAR